MTLKMDKKEEYFILDNSLNFMLVAGILKRGKLSCIRKQ